MNKRGLGRYCRSGFIREHRPGPDRLGLHTLFQRHRIIGQHKLLAPLNCLSVGK